MKITDFGQWLKEKRKERGLSTADFSQVDSGTISRIENGNTKARFGTVLEILSRLDISLRDFITDYLKIESPETDERQSDLLPHSQKALLDGGVSLYHKDIALLIQMYWEDEPHFHFAVLRLIGASVTLIMGHEQKSYENREYEDEDKQRQVERLYSYSSSDALIGHILLRSDHTKLFDIEWSHLIGENAEKIVLNAFDTGAMLMPEDAYVAFVSMIHEYNKDVKKDDRIKPAKLNKDRFRLIDILEPCSHFSDEDCVKIFSLFWRSYKFDTMLTKASTEIEEGSECRRWYEPSPKEVNELGTLLFTLWRWLQYYKEREWLYEFGQTVRQLGKEYEKLKETRKESQKREKERITRIETE